MIITVFLSYSGGKEKPPFVLDKDSNNHSSLFLFTRSRVNVFIYLRDDENTCRKKNDSCFGRRARKVNTIHILREGKYL